MTRALALSVLLLILLSLPRSASAQTASISGTVTDISGAVVPRAKISVQNRATNATRSTETDGSGVFRITNLVPGTFDVLVEKVGFKVVEYSQVQLTVDQVQNLNATLAPSGIAEKMTVNGESVAPLDSDDAQVGNMVNSVQVEALPLILRDPYQLILLSPGAVQGTSILHGLSVNGSRERNNNFLLDGTDNNDAEIPGLTLPQPGLTSLNPDSVQEFRVITSNFLPEFGRNTGAVIDIVSKRGTNDFHSDIYWFGRFDALGARDYFNHQIDSAGQVVRKDPYTRNTFGISAGGPLRRDRTFWFANYDGERFATTLTNTSEVPTQAFKSGVFSFNNVPIDVSSPTSPNNIFGLPLDPAIQKILALYPAPNGPSVDGARGLLFFPSSSHTSGDNADVRIDHNFSQTEALAVRYTFNRYEDPNFDHTDFLPGLGGTGTLQRRQNASLQLTSTVDPRLVNSFRLGANRINFPLTCEGLNVLDSVAQTDLYGRGLDVPLPGVAGFGCLLIVDRNGSRRFSGTYTIGDDVTWAPGRHTFKFGVELRAAYSNSTNDFISRPTLDFNNFANFGGIPAFMTGDPSVDSNQTLQDMVWSLFGTVGSVTQAQFFNKQGNRTADDLRGFRQKDFAAFAEDTFKILPNFTLSYGLRYQFNGVPYEVNDLLSTLFTDPGGQAPFTFTIAGRKEHGLPSLYSNDWHDFEPRVGMAWDPFKDGRTSIRGGYGIFHDRLFGQLLGLTRGNPPFQQIFFQPLFGLPPCPPPEIQTALGACIGPPLSQLPLPPSLTTSSVVNQGAGDLPFIIDPHLRMPYSQGWNFGVQREVTGKVVVELNYVGSRGTRLLRLVDGNPPQPALVAQLEAFCVPTNPANAGFNTPTGQCSQSTLQFNNLWFGAETGSLPFDAVNNNAFLHAEVFNNAASSIYHALQANISRRTSSGLTLQAAYTWAHAIDNSSDPLTPAAGNQEFPRNSLDLGAERSNSDFDVRQRLVLNYSWAIPLGRGHNHLAEGFAARMLGGWEVAGITTFSGGLPYDIYTATDTAHTGQQQRPDYNPTGTVLPVSNARTQTGPNLGLFSDAPWGRAGDLARNHFYGPGVNNWDMVLQKTVNLSERANLELRWETYNLFNRVQFGQPGNLTANPGTFGQSSLEVRRPDLTTGARQIQLGMKLTF
ncbi:MAG TPA: TonB-dependent receptor [Terriglobales bacterium]|nr:TonB-dependent receptor [Terriglobales bacterium]